MVRQKPRTFHIFILISNPFSQNLDKSASLLLCLPTYQLTAKKSINETGENEMRKRRAQLFHPVKDFRKYLSRFF